MLSLLSAVKESIKFILLTNKQTDRHTEKLNYIIVYPNPVPIYRCDMMQDFIVLSLLNVVKRSVKIHFTNKQTDRQTDPQKTKFNYCLHYLLTDALYARLYCIVTPQCRENVG